MSRKTRLIKLIVTEFVKRRIEYNHQAKDMGQIAKHTAMSCYKINYSTFIQNIIRKYTKMWKHDFECKAQKSKMKKKLDAQKDKKKANRNAFKSKKDRESTQSGRVRSCANLPDQNHGLLPLSHIRRPRVVDGPPSSHHSDS